jgi:GTP pyrophosphokinase
VIAVQWHASKDVRGAFYPVDVAVQARDRQGLLRDISDVFSREKINVIGVHTQSLKGVAWMTFTAELSDSSKLSRLMEALKEVDGVSLARRK